MKKFLISFFASASILLGGIALNAHVENDDANDSDEPYGHCHELEEEPFEHHHGNEDFEHHHENDENHHHNWEG